MGRYLLIEFDDNDSADRMRAQIDTAHANGKQFRVVGMFSRPSTLCDCSTRSGKSVRGAKFGWWLCTECRKPKSGSSQTLGNMLDDEGTPAKYRDLFLALRWILRDGKVTTAQSIRREDWR